MRGLFYKCFTLSILDSVTYRISFWWFEISYFHLIKEAVFYFLAGGFVPLWFYPDWLYSLIDILPFKNIVYTPLKVTYGKDRILTVDLEEDVNDIMLDYGAVIHSEGLRKQILFDRDKVSAIDIINSLSKVCKIKDFSLQDTDITAVIKQIYEA